jgi:GT2 family glycosyltransferase
LSSFNAILEEIAIVILNWNGKDFLKKFLPGVIEHANGALICLADNNSSDDSVAFVLENFPEIKLIQNPENGGFAKGYNDALKQVHSKYYLLLNSDIEVTPNWLLPLKDAMNDPQVAGCQPKILSYSNKKQFEHAGAAGGFLDRNYYPFCRGRIMDQFEEDHGQYDWNMEIFWATGAALLIRSELFHEMGGFDETFFAHMEEIDLCWRLKRNGYKFMAVPQSVVYHVGGGTLPYLSPKKSFLNFRNSLFMLIKNHEGLLFPKLFYRLILDGIAGVRFLLRGEFKHLWSIIRAHWTTFTQLKRLLKQRKTLKQASSKTNLSGIYNGNILWARYIKKIKKFSDLNQRLFITK